MESMGVASGCVCKKEVHVYRFPHITYPYSSCICLFFQQNPYFLFIFYTHVLLSRVKPEINCTQLAVEDGSTFVRGWQCARQRIASVD